jgi:hypothetical protein
MTGIRELRLLAVCGRQQFKLCKILFTANDASFYIIPYAKKRRYFCGGRKIEEHELKDTFEYTSGVAGDREPKLSIHQSGQVHIYSGKTQIGPLQSCPLTDLRGQHVATVSFDRFSELAQFEGALSQSGPEIDQVIQVDRNAKSGRLAIYVNSVESYFESEFLSLVRFTLTRPCLKTPMYISVQAFCQEPLGGKAGGGVTVVAGWNPLLPKCAEVDYLYIRGQ